MRTDADRQQDSARRVGTAARAAAVGLRLRRLDQEDLGDALGLNPLRIAKAHDLSATLLEE